MKVYIVKDYSDYDDFMEEPSITYGVFNTFEKAKEELERVKKEFDERNDFVLVDSDETSYRYQTEDEFSFYDLFIEEKEVK